VKDNYVSHFFVWLSPLLVTTTVNSSNIAVNFDDDDTREAFLGGQLIGPINTNSKYWNSSIDRDFRSLKAGRINNLIDNSGVQAGAIVVWRSKDTWRIDNGLATTDNQKLSRSYLGDGGPNGNLIIVSSIPYRKYDLYVLFSPGSMPMVATPT
ncbi:uncharacterized protein METZ01_LOCUS200800, partial [marine metagenome]|jgi:hypothetical protein|tara:strand:- start:81 stop:539 length:459 start_codon:yes stop_codon:yes gene_type:complete